MEKTIPGGFAMRIAVLFIVAVFSWLIIADYSPFHFAPAAGQTNATAEKNGEAEKTAIEKVVKDYVSVTDKQDREAIERAFHPSAKLMSVGKEGLREMSQEEWWGRISKIPNPKERKFNISLIDMKGLAAVVRVDFETSSDYLSLLKINGNWKIVNKTLSTQL
jgi:hypothetical protein